MPRSGSGSSSCGGTGTSRPLTDGNPCIVFNRSFTRFFSERMRNSSAVHSQTLPTMLYWPKPFGAKHIRPGRWRHNRRQRCLPAGSVLARYCRADGHGRQVPDRSPGKAHVAKAATRRVLPLRLARQTPANPGGIACGIIPRHVNHRMIRVPGRSGASRTMDVAPVGSSTRRHHSVPTTASVGPTCAGTSDQNTNDQPHRALR